MSEQQWGWELNWKPRYGSERRVGGLWHRSKDARVRLHRREPAIWGEAVEILRRMGL